MKLMKWSRVLSIVAIMTLGWICVADAQRPQRDPVMRIWTGVYTDAQAERGKDAFTGTCSSCHSADLTGGSGPALAGPKFTDKWELESLNSLFRRIKDNMPRNSPGSLDGPTAAALVSFILKTNGFPAGTTPASALTTDEEALDAIVIVPQTGPTKIPNFALVQVAGCLAARDGHAWGLTGASEPAPAKDVPATDAEVQAANARPPGTLSFRLVSAGPFAPEQHLGQKVFVKGIINRVKPEPLLNITALKPVGGTCPN